MKRPTDAKRKIESAKVASDLDELSAFALDSFVYVRAGVAINPNTTAGILLSLVADPLTTDDDFQVAVSLLSRASLPLAVAHRICTAVSSRLLSIQPRDYYPCEFVRRLVSHQSVTYADLCWLLRSKTCPRHLRGLAAASTQREDILECLSHDVSGSVAARARKRLATRRTGR